MRLGNCFDMSILAGLEVAQLGGGRRAAALAMLGVLAGGVYLGIDGYLSMNSFDPIFWMLCALALLRIVQSDSQREVRTWWIVFGLSAGLAFENKDSIAFFLVAMLVAVLVTAWSLRLGTSLEDRPRYTPTTTFETFPFPDGLEEAGQDGATAVIQPGGSVRDSDVIAAADRLGIAMVFFGGGRASENV